MSHFYDLPHVLTIGFLPHFSLKKCFFLKSILSTGSQKTPSATIEFADVEDSTIQKSVIFLKPLQKHMYLYDTQANLLYDRALITFWANKQTEVDAFFSYVDYLKKKMLEEYHIGALDKLAFSMKLNKIWIANQRQLSVASSHNSHLLHDYAMWI